MVTQLLELIGVSKDEEVTKESLNRQYLTILKYFRLDSIDDLEDGILYTYYYDGQHKITLLRDSKTLSVTEQQGSLTITKTYTVKDLKVKHRPSAATNFAYKLNQDKEIPTRYTLDVYHLTEGKWELVHSILLSEQLQNLTPLLSILNNTVRS